MDLCGCHGDVVCQSRKRDSIRNLECIGEEWEEVRSTLLGVFSSFDMSLQNQFIPVEDSWDDTWSWDSLILTLGCKLL